MMSMKSIRGRHQRGVSLVVVLILLLVVTLLGLAVLRGTLMSERMSANMYDRSLAFQSAESALREAEAVVRAADLEGKIAGVNCTLSGQTCLALPGGAHVDDLAGWTDAADKQALSTHPPQYLIHYMGLRDSIDELGLDSSANMGQYSSATGLTREKVYRVFSRSHDPSKNKDRAVVVLQANVAVK